MSKKITRRAALGASVLTFTIVLNGAPAQPRAAFGGVRVDVASPRAEVGDPTARWVAEELPRALAEALARVGRSGVPVAVRIDTVILGPSSGGQGPRHQGAASERDQELVSGTIESGGAAGGQDDGGGAHGEVLSDIFDRAP